MTRYTLLLAFVLMATLVTAGIVLARPHGKHKTWAVYYTDRLPFSRFAGYDILAFDSDHYPDFTARRHGQVILGYLSMAEAETYRPYYPEVEKLGVIMEKSDLWKQHMVIDIRKPAWRAYFIHTLVPQVLAKGFDGIMLDTIDTALYLEEEHPESFKGMRDAAIQFIVELRQTYPDTMLMLNRGFPILRDVAPYIDYLLAESIRVQYDFGEKSSRYFPQSDYEGIVADIKAARQINPHLQVVTLDYWETTGTNAAAARNIYREQREHGFIPYVTSADLMHQHPEP